MIQHLATGFAEAIVDTDGDKALQLVRQALATGVSPEQVVFEVVVPCMDHLCGLAASDGGLSVAQHFLAAQISSDVVEAMLPRFRRAPRVAGRVVIGTAVGDFHALGKRIVSGCLSAHMIEVTDLGMNVPPERFVEQALARDAQVIAVSSMMVHTARGEHGCRGVRRILRERGLEQQLKVVVGGAPYRFDEKLFEVVEADAWARSAIEAVPVVVRLVGEAGGP